MRVDCVGSSTFNPQIPLPPTGHRVQTMEEKTSPRQRKPPFRTRGFPAPETPNSFKVFWSPWVLRRQWWQVSPWRRGGLRLCSAPRGTARCGARRGACGSALAGAPGPPARSRLDSGFPPRRQRLLSSWSRWFVPGSALGRAHWLGPVPKLRQSPPEGEGSRGGSPARAPPLPACPCAREAGSSGSRGVGAVGSSRGVQHFCAEPLHKGTRGPQLQRADCNCSGSMDSSHEAESGAGEETPVHTRH